MDLERIEALKARRSALSNDIELLDKKIERALTTPRPQQGDVWLDATERPCLLIEDDANVHLNQGPPAGKLGSWGYAHFEREGTYVGKFHEVYVPVSRLHALIERVRGLYDGAGHRLHKCCRQGLHFDRVGVRALGRLLDEVESEHPRPSVHV